LVPACRYKKGGIDSVAEIKVDAEGVPWEVHLFAKGGQRELDILE
jgi:hypothetical protein